jgi:hypothetical protein
MYQSGMWSFKNFWKIFILIKKYVFFVLSTFVVGVFAESKCSHALNIQEFQKTELK